MFNPVEYSGNKVKIIDKQFRSYDKQYDVDGQKVAEDIKRLSKNSVKLRKVIVTE